MLIAIAVPLVLIIRGVISNALIMLIIGSKRKGTSRPSSYNRRGTLGKIFPAPDYFPLLRSICDENVVLLIADEVMTGWFRTGTAFAMEHWDVEPDIQTIAKGYTAAYTPQASLSPTRKLQTSSSGTSWIMATLTPIMP
jgi:hypothetical protein